MGIHRINHVVFLLPSPPLKLFLSRDRLGVRPLFYRSTPGTFSFASEAKAILSIPGVSRELDLFALDQIFSAEGDHMTVTGDPDELSDAASERLPPFLRVEGPRSARSSLDTDIDPPRGVAPRELDASIADEETQVKDTPSSR